MKSGVESLVTKAFTGVVRIGATGTSGKIVTVRAVLHRPQLPAASFARTCHEYRPSAIAGGVWLVVVNSAEA